MMSKKMRQAVLEDVPTILALLQKRIDWMDEKGLYQWNRTAYLTVYPAEYFAERCAPWRGIHEKIQRFG